MRSQIGRFANLEIKMLYSFRILINSICIISIIILTFVCLSILMIQHHSSWLSNHLNLGQFCSQQAYLLNHHVECMDVARQRRFTYQFIDVDESPSWPAVTWTHWKPVCLGWKGWSVENLELTRRLYDWHISDRHEVRNIGRHDANFQSSELQTLPKVTKMKGFNHGLYTEWFWLQQLTLKPSEFRAVIAAGRQICRMEEK